MNRIAAILLLICSTQTVNAGFHQVTLTVSNNIQGNISANSDRSISIENPQIHTGGQLFPIAVNGEAGTGICKLIGKTELVGFTETPYYGNKIDLESDGTMSRIIGEADWLQKDVACIGCTALKVVICR